LPLRDGLELWLDAGRVTADQPAPADGKLAEWRDASGKGRHLRQENPEARPTLVRAGSSAVVRFDGIGTHLRAVKQTAELKSFTVFVVAAPRHNLGGFRGMLAFNAAGERDYTSGLTIDLGPGGTPRFSYLNVEGRGFGGAKSLRTGDDPFPGLHTLEVWSDAAAKTVRLFVDSRQERDRARDPATLSMAEITVGARYYNHEPGPQRLQ